MEEGIQNWKDESNEKLEQGKHPYKIYNKSWVKILSIITVVSFILFLCSTSYLIYDEKLKTEIQQNITMSPLFNATINSETINDNQYNYTINNPLNFTCICNPILKCGNNS